MTRVHVWGASGYGAAEAIRILERHPAFELGALESASHAGETVGEHFPRLRAVTRRFDSESAVTEQLASGDAVVMGGSTGAARRIAPEFLARGARVVDLSVDFRFDSSAVYGLPERYRDGIAKASLVANPGCYPTAALLALLPLLPVADIVQIIIDAKSGITGAGRTPSVSSLFAEVDGEIRAYGLDGHRHQPEIESELRACGSEAPLVFTPHVVPLSRGLLADAYVMCGAPPDAGTIRAAYERSYASSPFVRVLPQDQAPSVAGVTYTNDAEVHVSVAGKVVRVICAIDNLGKGAAGQAVQNLNIMFGYPEELGLDARSLVA
jgi:N-acetyl-gamma-glutamyl-phosphate reductase